MIQSLTIKLHVTLIKILTKLFLFIRLFIAIARKRRVVKSIHTNKNHRFTVGDSRNSLFLH